MSEPQPTGKSAATPEAIRDWMLRELGNWTGLAPASIDLDRPFVEYDLDSLAEVAYASDLEAFLGFSVTPELFWDYPTIRSLSEELARQARCSGGAGP
jgi:acyl carrier protein